jgi:hypothetical protein
MSVRPASWARSETATAKEVLMQCARRLAIALMAVASITGCDDTSREFAPTQPSPARPASSPPSTVNGEITITSISPAPGATVPVRACAPETTPICSDEPKLTLEVVIKQVNEDIPNAVLSVRFGQCGFWSTPVGSITAGSRLSLTTSVISLSDHEGPGGAPAPPLCEFPAITAGIVVSLWRAGQPLAPPLLAQAFANGYTFVRA